MSQPSIPKKITIDENQTEKQKVNIIKCGTSRPDANCVAPIDFLASQSGMYGYMMIYAYSVFKFDKIKDLSFTVDGVKNVVSVINQGLV
jgi:hypothetical protein